MSSERSGPTQRVPAQGPRSLPVTGNPRVLRRLTGLFAADVISTTGTEMTAIALPWFVLVSTGSPARMGAVLAAQFAGISVLGLWGGHGVSLLGARRMMLVSDFVRAALVGLIPVLYWVGGLSFPVLLVVAFAVGGFFPGYSASQRLVLAGIVEDDELRLTRLGGLMSTVNETASFVGPALGGVLVVLFGAAQVLLVDAASYLCAVVLVAALVPAGRSPAEADEPSKGVREGLRYVFSRVALRRQVMGIGLVEVAFTAMIATLPVVALHNDGASVAGWLLAAFGAGSIVGGLISSRARKVDDRTAAWSVTGIALASWLLLLPVPTWALAGAVAANGVCSGLFFPRFFSALTTRTPPALRAQVLTSVTIAIAAPGSLGFLGAGLLAQLTGATIPSLLLVATAATLGAVLTVAGLTTPPIDGTAPMAHPELSPRTGLADQPHGNQ
jgi:MFS family permease